MPSDYRDGATYDRIRHPSSATASRCSSGWTYAATRRSWTRAAAPAACTQALIERLPRGHVIAVDGSPEMIGAARERLGDEAELLVQDLDELDLGARRVDAILSTATFHWLGDHPRLFARLRAVLRTGGSSRPSAAERATPRSWLTRPAPSALATPLPGISGTGRDRGTSPRRHRRLQTCARPGSPMSARGS